MISIPADAATGAVLSEVSVERARQEQLKAAGKFGWTCADDVSDNERIAILVEEVGEVARAICERDDPNLREELIQVAAVAVAWVEGLDAERAATVGEDSDAD